RDRATTEMGREAGEENFFATGPPPGSRPGSGTPNRVRSIGQAVERRPLRDRPKEPSMSISPLAGKPAPKELLVDVAKLEREYHDRRPDPRDPGQRVAFGTSGHRGTPANATFTEAHILAITQAI